MKGSIPPTAAPIALLVCVLLAVTSWRFAADQDWLGVLPAVAAVILSWCGERPQRSIAWPLTVVLGLLLLSLAKLIPDLWPCDLACQGLTGWQTVAGLPLVAWAAIGWACFGLLMCFGRDSSRWRQVLSGLAWAAAAGSVAFVALMMHLHVWCSHCLAIHSVVWCLPGLLRAPSTTRWRSLVPAVPLLTVLMLSLGLAQQQPLMPVVPDAVVSHGDDPLAATTSGDEDDYESNNPAQQDLATAITFAPDGQVISDDFRRQPQHDQLMIAADAGRRRGLQTAPWRLEIVLSLHCQHCRLRWPIIRDQLKPLIDDGQLQVVIRHRWQFNDPAQQEMMAVLWLAAANHQYETWLMRALAPARNNDMREPKLLAQAGLNVAQQQMFAPAIERLLRLEQYWLRQHRLLSGPVPAAQLFRRGRAKPTRRLSGSWGASEVLQLVAPVRD